MKVAYWLDTWLDTLPGSGCTTSSAECSSQGPQGAQEQGGLPGPHHEDPNPVRNHCNPNTEKENICLSYALRDFLFFYYSLLRTFHGKEERKKRRPISPHPIHPGAQTEIFSEARPPCRLKIFRSLRDSLDGSTGVFSGVGKTCGGSLSHEEPPPK